MKYPYQRPPDTGRPGDAVVTLRRKSLDWIFARALIEARGMPGTYSPRDAAECVVRSLMQELLDTQETREVSW